LEQSGPLLEQIKSQIQRERSDALPKSGLAKACNYTLTLWARLSGFLEHPELELSDNLAENAMRPLALGRRKWIHIGSEQAGPRVAAISSVVETCRRLKIPIRDYLGFLPGAALCAGGFDRRGITLVRGSALIQSGLDLAAHREVSVVQSVVRSVGVSNHTRKPPAL
jgi:hypothetical protein